MLFAKNKIIQKISEFTVSHIHNITVACWVIFHALLSSADFQNELKNIQKILSGTLSMCQMIWLQIRINILMVLIWVQTVCKGYQQMTKAGTCKARVDMSEQLSSGATDLNFGWSLHSVYFVHVSNKGSGETAHSCRPFYQ